MALCLGLRKRALDQHLPDAAVAERRLDRERAEQQRLDLADANRGEPYRANEQRSDMRRERKLQGMVMALADAIGGLGIAAGAEGALMQPLDGERIARGFGPDSEGKIGHRLVVKTPESPRAGR